MLPQPHGFTDLVKKDRRFVPGTLAVALEQVTDIVQIVFQLFPALAHGLKVCPELFKEGLFGVTVTVISGTVLFFHRLQFRFAGKKFVQRDHVAGIGIFGFFQSFAVGNDAHHGFPQSLFLAENGNGIVVALGHFLPVQTGNNGDLFGDIAVGYGEYFTVFIVEFDRKIAGNFQMLFLKCFLSY